MSQQFQIGRDKAPTDIGKNRVKHESLAKFWAYLPPLVLAGQGLSLHFWLVKQGGRQVHLGLMAALGLFIFSGYLFESLGLFSPEDKINQPLRFYYFKSHLTESLSVVSVSLIAGLVCFFSAPWSGQLLLGIFLGVALLFGYTVLRFKEGFFLKPFLVSLAWVSVLWGFSALSIDQHKIVFLLIFLFLLVDSLWLDLKDQKGDRVFGIRLKGLAFKALVVLHLCLGVAIWLLQVPMGLELHAANILLLISGSVGHRYFSRRVFGILIPLWSFFLLVLQLFPIDR